MESTAALQTLPPVTPSFVHAAAVAGSGRAETTSALAQAERHIEAHRWRPSTRWAACTFPAPPRGPRAPRPPLRSLGPAVPRRSGANSISERARTLWVERLLRPRARRVAVPPRLLPPSSSPGSRTRSRCSPLRSASARAAGRGRPSSCPGVRVAFALLPASAGMGSGRGRRAQRSRAGQQIGDGRLEALAPMPCSPSSPEHAAIHCSPAYAERARALAVENDDRQTEARIVNNLGGLSYLLGEPEVAVAYLKEAFALSLDVGNDANAAAGSVVARPSSSSLRRTATRRGAGAFTRSRSSPSARTTSTSAGTSTSCWVRIARPGARG